MRRSSRCLLIFLLTLCICFEGISQSRTSLEQERDRIVQQIEIADEQLKEAATITKSGLAELSALQAQIKSREQLIDNLKRQQNIGLRGIETNTDSIAKIDAHLDKLTIDFGKVMRLAHQKRRSHNTWISMFSANSFNEAILIFQYSNQFQAFLDRKKQEISHLKSAIQTKTQTILEEQSYIENLLADEKINFKKLAVAKEKKNALVLELKKDEAKLRSERDQKKKEREKLNDQIEAIIVKEMQKRANEKSKATATAPTSKHSLLWPVKNGYISSQFGEQAHPTIPSLKINNNGIDISAKSNSQVYTVMAGTVVGVTNIPGYDTMIILEHGELYTVYSKLMATNVAKGDEVALGQKIGELGKSGSLHFEIWKGKQKLDPEKWLKKQ